MVARKQLRILIVPADPEQNIKFRDLVGKDMTDPLPTIRQYIDGWAEEVGVVDLNGNRLRNLRMFIDEEGRLKSPPPPINMRASILYGFLMHGQLIVGNTVLIGYSDEFDHYKSVETPYSPRYFDRLFAEAENKMPPYPELYPMPTRKGR